MAKSIVSARIIDQRCLNSTIKLINVYAPDIAKEALPGQFVNVQVSTHTAPLLRRPLGVAGVNLEKGSFTMIYRILGEATHILAKAESGSLLSIIGPLGHGFDLKAERPLLVGGGLGLAPLLFLSEAFRNKSCDILMGGRNAEELFWTELFKGSYSHMFLTTDDGSAGTKGTVMVKLPELIGSGSYDCVYVCGPLPMMKAVAGVCKVAGIGCQVSLEKYMACGLGACLSCAFQGVGGRLKVCKDGPVFWAEEVGEW